MLLSNISNFYTHPQVHKEDVSMNEQFEKIFAQTTTFTAPMLKASKLAIAGLEKLVAFELATLQSYSDLTIARLKAATEISDVKGLQDFYTTQIEVLSTVRQKMMDDAKALTDIGSGVKAEFDKLAEETAAELPKVFTLKAA